MKRLLFLAAALVATAAPAPAETNVGLSLTIGEPGFYGRIDIGDYPPPRLIYRQPLVIERMTVVRPPIYLRVPPGHAKNWRKNCYKYDACDERVYFVRDDWYQREYVPRYLERHGKDRGDRGKGNGKDKSKDWKDHPGGKGGQGRDR